MPASRPAQVDRAGWLQDARRVPSPHCDERPAGVSVDAIIVHGISLPPGEFGGPWIDRLFSGQLDAAAHPYFQQIAALRVSAHALVRRDGELVQYVPFSRRAWHAGESRLDGRSCCNDFSVGIELEGADHIPYTDVQYDRLAELCRQLMACYPAIHPERIRGHADIAPGRKTDPGPVFDWTRLHQALARRVQD